jgi:hypothetical protein
MEMEKDQFTKISKGSSRGSEKELPGGVERNGVTGETTERAAE